MGCQYKHTHTCSDDWYGIFCASVAHPCRAVFTLAYAAEFGVNPDEVHEFTDEDDHAATEWQQVAGRKLTRMCRTGIPAHFRGGVCPVLGNEKTYG